MKHDSLNLTSPHTLRELAQAETEAGAMHAKQIATMIAEDAHLDRGDIGKPITGDHQSLASRLNALAYDCQHSDGWEGAVDDLRAAARILSGLPAAQIGGRHDAV